MRPRRFAVASLAGALAACSVPIETYFPPDGPTDGTPDFELRLFDPSVPVALGGKTRFEVIVTRTHGYAGDIAIEGLDLPAGVAVEPVVIHGDTGDVILTGSPPLAIGGTVTFSLRGRGADDRTHVLTVAGARVIGRPGALDTTFGAGAAGLAVVGFGSDDSGVFNHLDVAGGVIIATGAGSGGLGATTMATIRITAAGLVDTTWNGGALARSNFLPSGSNDTATAVATGRQTDGRSIVIGSNWDRTTSAPCPCTPDVAVVRYSLAGTAGGVDFGNKPAAHGTVDLGGTEVVTDGLVLPDSSIVAVGSQDGQLLVVRLTAVGSLDTTFAAPLGYDRLVLGTASRADAVIADGANRLVVAGTFVQAGQNRPILVRYTATGARDSTFGTNGQVTVPGAPNEASVALRLFGDKVLLATVQAGSPATVHLRRFDAAGALDESLDVEVPMAIDSLEDMVVAPDGGVLLLGDAAGRALVVRVTRRGAVDTLFGPDGTGAASIYIGDNARPRTLVIYDDHRLLVGGGNEGGTPGPGTFGIVGRLWN